jgi:hypothetical protein
MVVVFLHYQISDVARLGSLSSTFRQEKYTNLYVLSNKHGSREMMLFYQHA